MHWDFLHIVSFVVLLLCLAGLAAGLAEIAPKTWIAPLLFAAGLSAIAGYLSDRNRQWRQFRRDDE